MSQLSVSLSYKTKAKRRKPLVFSPVPSYQLHITSVLIINPYLFSMVGSDPTQPHGDLCATLWIIFFPCLLALCKYEIFQN